MNDAIMGVPRCECTICADPSESKLSAAKIVAEFDRKIERERKQEMRWCFIVFNDNGKMVGAAIVMSRGPLMALNQALVRGIVPEGERMNILFLGFDNGTPPDRYCDRLLSPHEANAAYAVMRGTVGTPIDVALAQSFGLGVNA